MAPGRTNHAATPVAGVSVDGNSCLMQRQPVHNIGAAARIAPTSRLLGPAPRRIEKADIAGM